MTSSVEIAHVLRAAGLRVTAIRLAVYDALTETPHADTDRVARAVRSQLGTASIQAVYDVLRAFVGAGLARRVEPAGMPARYELRVDDNHHHVACRLCGAIADIDCAVGETPCLTPETTAGFSIDEAEVTYWGLCASCTGLDEHTDEGRTS